MQTPEQQAAPLIARLMLLERHRTKLQRAALAQSVAAIDITFSGNDETGQPFSENLFLTEDNYSQLNAQLIDAIGDSLAWMVRELNQQISDLKAKIEG